MRRPPVLKSRCWRLVSDQLWMVRGKFDGDAKRPGHYAA
jgi:hypothetical protein